MFGLVKCRCLLGNQEEIVGRQLGYESGVQVRS